MRCIGRTAAMILIPWLGLAATLAVAQPTYPPTLPAGRTVATDASPVFLQAPEGLEFAGGVSVATTAPTIDFLYYPMQNEPDYWSNWGEGIGVGDKYYSTFGNHKGIGGESFVYEYDAATHDMRLLLDVTKYLDRPKDWYTPGKIHGRLDIDRDGWIYLVTARGSTRVTTPENHFRGEWLIRVHPQTGRVETVAYPVLEGDSVMDSVLDADRMIFYGGTVAGDHRVSNTRFFAYDVANRKLLHEANDGPYRLLVLARSTGRVYYTGRETGDLYRYDPASGQPPRKLDEPGVFNGRIRAVTHETAQGHIFVISHGSGSTPAIVHRFHAGSEQIETLGDAEIGRERYITSVAADPTGRYLYYVPGAHGSAHRDGTPVVQFDTRNGRRKVIAFLRDFYYQTYGYTPMGTYGVALDDKGERLFITFSGNRGGPDARGRLTFDTCALMVVHIPESERRP
jgi:hypothetical protein